MFYKSKLVDDISYDEVEEFLRRYHIRCKYDYIVKDAEGVMLGFDDKLEKDKAISILNSSGKYNATDKGYVKDYGYKISVNPE